MSFGKPSTIIEVVEEKGVNKDFTLLHLSEHCFFFEKGLDISGPLVL